MAGRWRDPSAFRAAPDATPDARPSRRQTLALLAVLALVTGAVVAASYVVRPGKARAFDLFHGSVFLNDQLAPVAVDLASGEPTLRLLHAEQQVGIRAGQALGVVPLQDHTLLLNESTGEFNMVDNNGFVVKHDGGGVPLVPRPGTTTSVGIDAGGGQAYIVRTGLRGGTDVYLVNQPTVEAALSAARTVRPRASGSMPQAGTTQPGGAASANGDLWLLVGRSGTGGVRTIRQMHVPADSSTGATLVPSDHGRVAGPAAIGTAATGSATDSTAAVGVASVSWINLFVPGAAERTFSYQAPAGVRTILPASNQQGRLAFLMHGSAGWYLVQLRTDGSGLRVPTLVRGLPADARLAEPAASEGHLYSIDKATGVMYEIDYGATAEPVPGTHGYPTIHVEPRNYDDAYVIGRGPRVIYDSPSHDNAVVVFTDGSRSPLTIEKSSAVNVDAASGAEALTRSDVPPGQSTRKPTPGAPQPKPRAVEPINTKVDCHTATQTPHIPVITSAVTGSRTVTLAWSYPLISVQDCVPSTYVVSLSLISNDAPQPPSSVVVNSQTGATIGGLFPSTRYSVTVTAYLHTQHTASVPQVIVTGPEGPAAPTGLTVSADRAGNWHLAWDSCGTVAQGCVPAQSWTITPAYCDGLGLSSPPTPLTVTADPTSKRQPPAVYPTADDLLGRGLRFQVQGTGDQGQAGAPSAESPCVYSWTPPVAADISVQASTPPQAATSQDTTTTTATVAFAKGQVHDLGGVGGTLTYQLLENGTVVDAVGPTTRPTVTLTGIRAAEHYQVTVLASPPRHPEVVVPIGPVDVVPAIAAWPALQVAAPTFTAPPGLDGTLHVSFAFPPGTDSRGETFDLVDSQLSCGGGNTVMNLTDSGVSPGDDLTFPVLRSQYNGPCTVTLQLTQDPATATNPPLYGAGPSQAVTSSSVVIDPPSVTSTAADFTAQWGPSFTDPTVVVTYHGGDDMSGATNWRMTVTNDGGTTDCGTVTGNAPPATIGVSKACIKAGGTFQVEIGYTYFGAAQPHFTVNVGGQAPTPVDPSQVSFTAAWNSDASAPQIVLTYTGSEPADALATLSWTEVVTSSGTPGVDCVTQHDDPYPTLDLGGVLAACPATPDLEGNLPVYTVEVSFTDPNYGQTGDYRVTVQGTPPQ